jgi:ubiquinol-cytochrome c reductase cytochrome b subunit
MNNILKKIQEINIKQIQKDIIIGTLLGDSKIVANKNKTASIVFEQSSSHKLYLESLFLELKDLINQSEIKKQKRLDKRYNKINISYWFTTKSTEFFYLYFTLFYKKIESTNKYYKIVPDCIYDLLSPCALAYWICDDGSKVKRGGVTLCTDSFSKDEVFKLKSVLETKYNFICTIHEKKNRTGNNKIYYRIYISAKSLALLKSLVKEYMYPSMIYKLDE